MPALIADLLFRIGQQIFILAEMLRLQCLSFFQDISDNNICPKKWQDNTENPLPVKTENDSI
jgi:hypothetical protein